MLYGDEKRVCCVAYFHRQSELTCSLLGTSWSSVSGLCKLWSSSSSSSKKDIQFSSACSPAIQTELRMSRIDLSARVNKFCRLMENLLERTNNHVRKHRVRVEFRGWKDGKAEKRRIASSYQRAGVATNLVRLTTVRVTSDKSMLFAAHSSLCDHDIC